MKRRNLGCALALNLLVAGGAYVQRDAIAMNLFKRAVETTMAREATKSSMIAHLGVGRHWKARQRF